MIKRQTNYFLKWLPLEGDIGPGDWFWSDPVVMGRKLWQNTSAITAKSDWLHGYTLTKVKLFVCSNEIRPGDIVMEEGRFIEFEWTRMMDSCLPADRVFKKISDKKCTISTRI